MLADTNSTAILGDGSLGKGVVDVTIERTEDNDCSRMEASHDGYLRGFGLIHKRSLMLGNDGKELRGADQAGLAVALRIAIAERVHRPPPRLDLVWTGPETRASIAQDTSLVFHRLFASAHRSFIVGWYTFYIA